MVATVGPGEQNVGVGNMYHMKGFKLQMIAAIRFNTRQDFASRDNLLIFHAACGINTHHAIVEQ